MDYLYALQCIRESSPDFVNWIFVFFSEFVLKGGVIIGAMIYWCIDKSHGITILLGYTSSYSVNQLIKNTACVYRPWLRDSRLHVAAEAEKTATGYSFPSGHTVTGASIFGGISIWQRKRKMIVFLMSFMIVMVAFSRNWLGAHTMADVVMAVVETAFVLCFISFARYLVFKFKNLDTIFCFGGIALSIIILLILQFKNYPIDYAADGSIICDPYLILPCSRQCQIADGSIICDPYLMLTDCYTACGMSCGTLLGWWIERRFINFNIYGGFLKRVLRFVCGITLVLIPYFLGNKIFGFLGVNGAHLVKYFIMVFIATAIYPAILKLIEKKSRQD